MDLNRASQVAELSGKALAGVVGAFLLGAALHGFLNSSEGQILRRRVHARWIEFGADCQPCAHRKYLMKEQARKIRHLQFDADRIIETGGLATDVPSVPDVVGPSDV